MKYYEQKINRNLMIGWIIIVIVLLVAYFGEFLKGERSGVYMLMFSLVTVLPAFGCLLLYFKNKENHNLRYFIISGYYIMYMFVLLTGNTTMVFTYILPLLTLIVLYHQPKLVLSMGIVSLIANLAYDAQLYMNGKITMENSKDIEIQIALIILCFGFLYVASKLYDDIQKKNQIYVKEIDDKTNEIQRVTLQTITTIANIIDAKDEYTKGHSQRVAEYSASIAMELGYDEEAVRNVQCIGLLHDIGKIGIPDSILNKPGRLTEEEFALMKQHVVIGGNILKDNNMIKDLEKGARYHHEKYDGTGYVECLKGEEIPEIARIIGLADAYDAMTSNRVYRKRLSDEEVIAELRRCSGAQFDPKITEVFIKLLKENRIEQLSPDCFVMPDNLGEQSTQLLRNIIEMQNQQGKKDKEHDYLTGTYTRESGAKKIKEILQQIEGALVIVDIANLHEVNCQYGFISGDYLIRAVADVLMGYQQGIIVSRYDGDELLCFILGITSMNDMEDMMSDLYEKITKEIHGNVEYKDAQICMGGTLSIMLNRDYSQMIMAAEKALYYRKQLKQSGWHIFRKADQKREENVLINKQEFNQLIAKMKQDSAYEGSYQVNYLEFVKIFEYVNELGKRNNQSVQVILLSVCPLNEQYGNVSARDEAMDCLENAVKTALRKVDVMMRFSSSQCVIFLINLSREQIDIVINRILNQFYRIYTRKDMTINYEVADLK